MESPPFSLNPKKPMFPASSSQFTDDDDDVVLSDLTVSWTPKSDKGKEVIMPDGIKIEDSDNAMFDGDQVDRSIKGKTINYSYDEFSDHKAKGAVANNFCGSSMPTSTSDNINYTNLFLDDAMDVDDYCQLLAHFDSADISPGVEAPIPRIPWLFNPFRSDMKSVSGSSSDTNYQAANSFASSLHNVIDLAGPSSNASNFNDDYSDLYLEESIDIDEYAELLAHFDKTDIPPGIEAPIPHFLSLSDHPKSSIKAVPAGSSSSLMGETNVSSPALRPSSSCKLPQVSSSKTKQSYLQHQGNASNIPVGLAIISKSQEQTQNNDSPAKQVSSMETDETFTKLKDFKQFDTVEDHSDHYYANMSCSTMQKNWAKRIQEEWKILEKDLPDKIFVRVYETRMDLLRAVIVGAEGTPYHDGLFFFDVSFPSGYPNVPPLVYYHAHGLRLNPNLYDCGKVCLSLLNTWSGGKQEKWIPGTSTMLQVLVSIQGLILNSEPYFNEPGWAPMKGTASGEMPSKKYNEDTLILSLRTMVYIMKKPPKYFEDFVIGHFHNHAHDILSACKAYRSGAQVGSLIKGLVQGFNVNMCCSQVFKNSLAQFLPTLVKELTHIGAKDCEKFLSPGTAGK